MESFLKEVIEGNKFELLIDTNIFSQNIVLKAAYNFLNRAYFFFKLDTDGNIILQCTKKEQEENIETILADFSDEILSVYLRDTLEKDNKEIREKIVGAAIANSLDMNNFIQIDTEKRQEERNEIDFDKDIDEILREIENDPDLKIDEEEIQRILKEIEEETEGEINFSSGEQEPQIHLDINAIENVKKKFQNRD
ncbi:His-Xaa-Ser system protein HxsD [Candidatus Gracilibacteria bacterium]|nr:His-Xaa-Ser system protein HxsD [Candidatus Gracilibacteria bacterium]NUJ98852.1 His-Xaa-Ser system protein HxsD [Candidatus Gracilibacteria bacterium]